MRWRPTPVIAATLGYPFLSALARTWRTETHGLRHFEEVRGTGFAFMLWHEMLVPLLWQHQQQHVAIVVSGSRDGRYLAELASRLGYLNLFGSSTRGGARVLLQAIRALEDGSPVAFTPDGPRGPRREVKPGVVRAAQRAGATILPVAAVADRCWRLSSWDRLVVPKPGARVRIGYAEPYGIAPGDAALIAGVARAERALADLEAELAWPDAATLTA
jgi:lysophospholipid acyltransferase (LPLAT)-like uncharacterized protein